MTAIWIVPSALIPVFFACMFLFITFFYAWLYMYVQRNQLRAYLVDTEQVDKFIKWKRKRKEELRRSRRRLG